MPAMKDDIDYKAIVEAAGAVWIGSAAKSVTFRDPITNKVCLLYPQAVSTENVEMALKNAREEMNKVPLA